VVGYGRIARCCRGRKVEARRCQGRERFHGGTARAAVPRFKSLSITYVLGTPRELRTAARFSRLGPIGIWGNLHQRSNQLQQSLLLGAAPFSQEIRNFNMRQTASRRSVGLMNYEHTTVRRLPTKKPTVAIWAAIQFSPF
jgi:hypothetical protein